MATYYWVGGTGTWSGTGNTQFAITSGGVPTALNPTNADTVNFDANSGAAATITVTSTAVSLNTFVNTSDINLSLSGSPTLCTAAGTLTLTAGTITLNNFTLSIGLFSSNNANTRAIAFGTGNITVTGNANTVWGMANATGFTYTGTPTVNLTYSGATGSRSIFQGSTGGTEANSPSFNFTAGTDTVGGSSGSKVKNLIFTGFAGTYSQAPINAYGNVTFSTGMTITATTSAMSFLATSGTQQLTTNNKTIDFPITQNCPGASLQLQDNCTLGATRTFTFIAGTLDLTGNSGNWTFTVNIFSGSGAGTRAIAFGTGNITVLGNAATVWSMANINGFTYTGTPTVNSTYSGSTGTRTLTHGSSGNGSQTTAVSFNISAGSDIVTLTGTAYIKNLNFTGFAGTLSNTAQNIYGNLTLVSGMTLTAGTLATTFAATSGTNTITTAAKTLDFPLTFNGLGGTFAFQDALTQGSTRAFTITNGTVQLKASATSIVGSFVANSATMKYLQSTLAGTQATLSQASGTVNASNLTIKDINATGGATWNAYYINGDINAGNNTGWDFLVQLGRYIYSRRKNKVILN